jgi:hypothetical protein
MVTLLLNMCAGLIVASITVIAVVMAVATVVVFYRVAFKGERF